MSMRNKLRTTIKIAGYIIIGLGLACVVLDSKHTLRTVAILIEKTKLVILTLFRTISLAFNNELLTFIREFLRKVHSIETSVDMVYRNLEHENEMEIMHTLNVIQEVDDD